MNETNLAKKKVANALRYLACEMVHNAKSGHVGGASGFADAMTALVYQLKFHADQPNWINRDRMILSCGHLSALWYAVLYGYGMLTKEDLQQFRQLHSRTPGHPERGPGIDMTTGPLGMGFAWSVGFAVAEAKLRSQNRVSHFTYVVCSDGDLMEGASYEAAALAGHYRLSKLIALWDDNDVTLDDFASISRSENVKMRFEAQNWNVVSVDGHDIDAVETAIAETKKNHEFVNKPTLIACKTEIGKYTKQVNSSAAHGFCSDMFDEMKNHIEFDEAAFFSEFNIIKQKNKALFDEESNFAINNKIIYKMPTKTQELAKKLKLNAATRSHSQAILEAMNDQNLIICNADVGSSCGTLLKNGKRIIAGDFSGNLLMCGVREMAMISIAGGITAHSTLRAVTSTFLVFSDFARPAIRLAALMQVPIIMIFTHDSVFIGEDGPTHQPVEHADSLRLIPNLLVARPADGFETYYTYEEIFAQNNPAILILTRQILPTIHKNFIDSSNLELKKCNNLKSNNCKIIISTGSELHLALQVGEQLGFGVISLPILNFFTPPSPVLLNYDTVYIIEATTCICLSNYITRAGKKVAKICRIEEFGHSGTIQQLQAYFKFILDEIVKKFKSEEI